MEKRTREKAALALVALLGLVVLLVAGWYILAGHSWNVAASNIDDSIGQMDGYTVILFEGNRQESLLPEAPNQDLSSTTGEASSTASETTEASGTTQATETTETPETTQAPVTARASDVLSASAIQKARQESQQLLEETAQSYSDKDASVYKLDIWNSAFYEQPQVFSKGNKRVGVFLIDHPFRSAQARVDVKLLKKAKADFIIGISPDEDIVSSGVQGINLIIESGTSPERPASGFDGSSYCVYTPYLGEVEAVIISPSGVITSKTTSANNGDN